MSPPHTLPPGEARGFKGGGGEAHPIPEGELKPLEVVGCCSQDALDVGRDVVPLRTPAHENLPRIPSVWHS